MAELPYSECIRDAAQHFPLYLRSVLAVGSHREALAAVLQAQGAEAHDPSCREPGRPEAAALWMRREHLRDAEAAIGRLARVLPETGLIFLLIENPAYGGHRVPGSAVDLDSIVQFMARLGWQLYRCVAQLDPAVPAAIGESEADHQVRACGVYVIVCVRPGYSPRAHAAQFFDAGEPERAFHVLNTIPDGWIGDAVERYGVELERHFALLSWAQQVPREKQIYLFAKAQQSFFFLAYNRPDFPTGYQCQAAFWALLNRTDMALRTLRSFQQVYPDEGVALQVSRFSKAPPPPLKAETDPPPWSAEESGRPRILMVMPARPHFGLDVLFDGLCRTLGAENVTEYPRKPSLHGETPEQYSNYPCLFSYPESQNGRNDILETLAAGAFDLVLWGDCEQILDLEESRALAAAARGLPLFILDAVDECCSFRRRTLEYLDRGEDQGYFKREMLRGWDYGPRSWPMPFAYPDAHVAGPPVGERPVDFFWAGHRFSGLRRLYLERLERVLGRSLDERYAQEEYAARLGSARIGLNLFGYGFDTVRYWELPAHGVLLLSERLPIRIPHDFEEGISAMFFEDTLELEQKLASLMARPEEVAAIAAAGYRRLVAHHTGSARARQVLGWVQQSCLCGEKA